MAASSGSVARVSSTNTCGTFNSIGRCTISAPAPCSTAVRAKSCPSAFNPGIQQNAVPGFTLRESKVSAVISTSCSSGRNTATPESN